MKISHSDIVMAICDARDEVAEHEPPDAQEELIAGINYAASFIGAKFREKNSGFDYGAFIHACGVV